MLVCARAGVEQRGRAGAEPEGDTGPAPDKYRYGAGRRLDFDDSAPRPDPGLDGTGRTDYGRNPTIEEALMYVRTVRFTDVSTERMQELLARIEESDGPPPGVPATGLQVLFDEAQGTAVVLQQFESAEDMEAGGKVFSAMDSSETPGTRASVDMCELKVERTLS